MKIFSGNANQVLAKDIAAYLGINLGRVKVRACVRACVCVCVCVCVLYERDGLQGHKALRAVFVVNR